MTPEQRHRKAVRKWRKRLFEVSREVRGRTPASDLRALLAFDEARIEGAFYGLCAMFGTHRALEKVHSIITSIADSAGDPDHWRNRESRV